ncbi:type II toxin-antitoxin system RelE/ParE family toxin [Thiohalocapsa marina]|uniref:Type II toxin-antitoxin system RelE/ParE family toxin n=1 Tax=Thiohalocapsa marina TaxID=424902 RepID=A0A5M8FGJ4_9GAMM|nr:type II toxin-antitoxin system RelE/ParE family toxin [Thiohalocapsa marina]
MTSRPHDADAAIACVGDALRRRQIHGPGDAVRIEDLRLPPSNRLEKLGGDRQGQWSFRVNQQWRICFLWVDGDAFDVELVDYH